ncbi:MAG: hypothetical protein AAFR96_11005, partial [Planctomycetota bacterium]
MTPAAAVCVALVCSADGSSAQDRLSIAGTWELPASQNQDGLGQTPGFDASARNTVQLPGSLQAQGYGTPPGPDTEWVGNVRENEWA